MKILVTGGSGFIGSHIVSHYQETAEEIRVLTTCAPATAATSRI